MKRLLVALMLGFVAVLPGAALVDAPAVAADPETAVLGNTAGAVILEVDGIAQTVMFVSTKGQIAVVPVAECRTDPECVALGTAIIKAGRMQELNLKGSAPT